MNSKNNIINNNRYFKVVFIKKRKKKEIYIYIDKKKYELYKYIFIIKLHQILLDNNIMIFEYNISHFKIIIHLISIVLNDIK